MYWINHDRQIEMHVAEPFVPESSSFDCEIVTEELIKYESLRAG
jgi:hypothetical protein